MRVFHLIGAILFLFASPAMAKEAASAWIVTQKSGEVRVIKNGMQPASVQVRDALAPGEILQTGATGRAMLTRGSDYVVVAPGSRLLLPKEEQKSGFTRLIQQVGTMLYKVKHTGIPHFAVDTPMLAAVVKGTTFTVVVDQNRAAVQVTEGVVEVSALDGDARRLVEGGMTVYIGRERPDAIIEMKPGATSLPRPSGATEGVKIESSGDVPLSTVTDLTGGLVREAPTTPVLATASSPATVALAPAASVIQSTAPTTAAPAVAGPVVSVVDTPVPVVVDPVAEIVDSLVPTVTDPVVDIVGVAPTVTSPVVDIVQAVVPTVADPVVDIVDAVVPTVTNPVVDIVDAVVPTVTDPVVDIVDAVVPTVTAPVIEIVDTVTEPVIEIVDAVLPGVLGGDNSGSGGGDNSGPGSLNSGSGSGGNSGPGGGGSSGPSILEPVIDIVETTVPPVVEPVVGVVETVTQPVTGLIGGLFGRP